MERVRTRPTAGGCDQRKHRNGQPPNISHIQQVTHVRSHHDVSILPAPVSSAAGESEAIGKREAYKDIRFLKWDSPFEVEQQHLDKAFERVKNVIATPEWILMEDVEKMVLPPTTDLSKVIYVTWPFSGRAFEHLTRNKYRIYGPHAIIQALDSGCCLPDQGEVPCANLALLGKYVCCSSLVKTRKMEVYKKVKMMGGKISQQLIQACNLLIAENPGSQKYFAAAQQGIPVVLPDFIDEVWEKYYRGQSNRDLGELVEKHRLPIFKGLSMTTSRIPTELQNQLRKKIISNKGNFNCDLIFKKTTHLICSVPSGAKYESAIKHKIPVVLPAWIDESLEKDYCLDWNKYLLEAPRAQIEVNPVKSVEHAVQQKGPPARRTTSTPYKSATELDISGSSLNISSIPQDQARGGNYAVLSTTGRAKQLIHLAQVIQLSHNSIREDPNNHLPILPPLEPNKSFAKDTNRLEIRQSAVTSKPKALLVENVVVEELQNHPDDDRDISNATYDEYEEQVQQAVVRTDLEMNINCTVESEESQSEVNAVIIPEDKPMKAILDCKAVQEKHTQKTNKNVALVGDQEEFQEDMGRKETQPELVVLRTKSAQAVSAAEKESQLESLPQWLASKMLDFETTRNAGMKQNGCSIDVVSSRNWPDARIDKGISQKPTGSPKKLDPKGGVFYSQSKQEEKDRLLITSFTKTKASKSVASDSELDSDQAPLSPQKDLREQMPLLVPVPIIPSLTMKDKPKISHGQNPTIFKGGMKEAVSVNPLLAKIYRQPPLLLKPVSEVAATVLEDTEPALFPCKKKSEPEAVLMLSGFSTLSEKAHFMNKLKEMGVKCLNTNEYDDKCTHLVMGSLTRNEKFLSCVAAGKWILHSDFLFDSIKNQKLMPPEMYELGNGETARSVMNKLKKSDLSMARAAHYWRKKIEHEGKRAFNDWKVILVCAKERMAGFSRLLRAGSAEIVATSISLNDSLEGVTHLIYEVSNRTSYISEAEIDHFAKYGIQIKKAEFLAAFICDEPFKTSATRTHLQEKEFLSKAKPGKSARRSSDETKSQCANKKLKTN